MVGSGGKGLGGGRGWGLGKAEISAGRRVEAPLIVQVTIVTIVTTFRTLDWKSRDLASGTRPGTAGDGWGRLLPPWVSGPIPLPGHPADQVLLSFPDALPGGALPAAPSSCPGCCGHSDARAPARAGAGHRAAMSPGRPARWPENWPTGAAGTQIPICDQTKDLA